MRDPKRIPVTMNDIMHVWERFPDLRLGQLISSAMHGCGVDLYYIEDDELVKRIQEEFKGSKFYGNQDNT
jgi:hypothetical protein